MIALFYHSNHLSIRKFILKAFEIKNRIFSYFRIGNTSKTDINTG